VFQRETLLSPQESSLLGALDPCFSLRIALKAVGDGKWRRLRGARPKSALEGLTPVARRRENF